MPLKFVTGGASSGKTKFALSLLKESQDVTYIATGLPIDEEMRNRIEKHKSERPPAWETVEEPVDIKKVLTDMEKSKKNRDVIIDCLTFWVSNLIYMKEYSDETIMIEAKELAEKCRRYKNEVVVVTNELGMSIIPENRDARRFRKISGEVNQIFAAKSREAYLVVSGIGIKIKEII